MANQHTYRLPFCDFLERYLTEQKPKWKKSHLRTQRVGLGRFDEWFKICGYKLHELNWQKLLEFHRFVALQGASVGACQRAVQNAKHALRWGIERKELPQKLEELYTYHHSRHEWKIELPKLSLQFLHEFEPTRPGAFKVHRYAHRVFHTYLLEKNLTYRRFKVQHAVGFLKYLNEKQFHRRSRAVMPTQIRTYLRWLYKNRKISRHPDDIFPLHLVAKRIATLPRPLEPEIDQKLQELLESTEDIYYKAILLIRRTGLRISELKELSFNCIQIDQKGRTSLIVPPIKLGIERRVPLDPKTVELIKKIQIFSQKNYKKKSDPPKLVIGLQGRPPRYERFSGVMTEICARLNVKKWINLHALRHTYATSLLNAGLSITSLKEILGHKAINMSLGYAKVSQQKIHAEYSQAILKMSEKHIPNILEPKPGGINETFADLGSIITKSLDGCESSDNRKKLKALQARLSKIKIELSRLL